jgi:hypothetical protein
MATGNFNLPDQAHGPNLYLGLLTFAWKTARVSIRPELNPIQFLWTGLGESLKGGRVLPIPPYLAVLAADVRIHVIPALWRRLLPAATRYAPTLGLVMLVGIVVPNAGNTVPAGTPRGSYWIGIGAYHKDTGERWPIFVGGQRMADRIFLTQVQVTP